MASDFLANLDSYIFEATRWCILSQLIANMWEYIEKGVEWDQKKLPEEAAKQVRERFARLLPTPLPIADAVAAVPANRLENDLAGAMPPPEHGH